MKVSILSILLTLLSFNLIAQSQKMVVVNTEKEPLVSGKFVPTWESLSQYKAPTWFRNAKFGIWAHWGPQCQPEMGDWYGRFMYNEGGWQYTSHIQRYGHPSKFGFKDVINEWKAQNWEPEKLVALYKRVGAQYFFAMANHHDNLDLWNSKYQEWNSVRVGPKKDIVAGWAAAAKKYKLPFGLSVHASHAWTWYETSQCSDTAGVLKGVPYDGKLTKADGKGTWWEGLDPQELYEQNHPLSKGGGKNVNALWNQWDWNNGASVPSQKYCDKFYNRTMDLINQYHPDLIYFDDSRLPLYPISDAGLKIAANYYNANMAQHNGKLEAVLFGKILDEDQKKCMVWDVERGAPDKPQENAWQTCTCIGDWHYNRGVYEGGRYKSATTVVRMLVDIVSKNGNLLLNIPVRGDGTIDDKEVTVLDGIASWMDINKESIFDTRPCSIYGEGPSVDLVNKMNGPGFNEGNLAYSAKDVRYAQKGNLFYATIMGVPTEDILLKVLVKNIGMQRIKKVEMLGSKEKLTWKLDRNVLEISKPRACPSEIASVFKITVAK
ncbi:MAG TPA: alpha-L-fucosidase [Bacteroidales bacterium]|nr:alpha-L-fucosidase [Bacteroidales bacterium]